MCRAFVYLDEQVYLKLLIPNRETLSSQHPSLKFTRTLFLQTDTVKIEPTVITNEFKWLNSLS